MDPKTDVIVYRCCHTEAESEGHVIVWNGQLKPGQNHRLLTRCRTLYRLRHIKCRSLKVKLKFFNEKAKLTSEPFFKSWADFGYLSAGKRTRAAILSTCGTILKGTSGFQLNFSYRLVFLKMTNWVYWPHRSSKVFSVKDGNR